MTGTRIPAAYDRLTYAFIGCAMAVHCERAPDFREDTYQRDLEARFADNGLVFQAQELLEVYGDDGKVLVGYSIPDFIVADPVIVEIKALASIDSAHVAQVTGNLAVTGARSGWRC